MDMTSQLISLSMMIYGLVHNTHVNHLTMMELVKDSNVIIITTIPLEIGILVTLMLVLVIQTLQHLKLRMVKHLKLNNVMNINVHNGKIHTIISN